MHFMILLDLADTKKNHVLLIYPDVADPDLY